MPGVLTLFGKTLEQLRLKHVRTQVDSPWTNGKIERFWGVLQAELLDREVLPHARGGGRGPDPLRALLRLPPAQRRHRLADPGRTLGRDTLHRPWLRARPGAGAPAGLAHRVDGRMMSCSTNPGNYT